MELNLIIVVTDNLTAKKFSLAPKQLMEIRTGMPGSSLSVRPN
jgi:hypothetical protein